MTKKSKLLLLSTFYLLLSTFFYGCSPPYYKETRLLMGTFVEITCQDAHAINEAFEAIRKIEAIANTYEPSSEISRLNQEVKFRASNDMFHLVKKSLHYYALSNGAFDITVAPLVTLWKHKIKAAENKDLTVSLPPPEEIQRLMPLIGSDKIILDENTSTIAFLLKNMAIDLGAIAKGYAVDKAIERLKELGVRSALVNAGGNMYCLGKKGSRGWRIGIRHPRKPEKILYYLNLENQAVSTSGDYEQYFISEGRRYSHIINPKTGYPVDNKTVSATIIAETAADADCLSTAVFVLGKKEGEKLLKKIGIAEFKILEEKDFSSYEASPRKRGEAS